MDKRLGIDKMLPLLEGLTGTLRDGDVLDSCLAAEFSGL